MNDRSRNELLELIENAFKNVDLGDGIGIYEADSIDRHGSEDEKYRAKIEDLRENWHSIPPDIIDEFHSSLTFMDEKGLRFAIPAYMTFTVKYFDTWPSASIDSVVHCLASNRNWNFLSMLQRQAVAKFLSFVVFEADSYIDTAEASLAYEKIWFEFDYDA